MKIFRVRIFHSFCLNFVAEKELYLKLLTKSKVSIHLSRSEMNRCGVAHGTEVAFALHTQCSGTAPGLILCLCRSIDRLHAAWKKYVSSLWNQTFPIPRAAPKNGVNLQLASYLDLGCSIINAITYSAACTILSWCRRKGWSQQCFELCHVWRRQHCT